MRTSLLYLGESLQYEASLRASSPCDLWQLHRFAQRVLLLMGAMGDKPQRAKLAALVPRIDAHCGTHFMAQMTRAYAYYGLGQPAEAEAAWRRAQTLVVREHPWAMLVPEALGWADPPPFKVQLVEEERGRVYAITSGTPMAGAGYLFRLASGSLALVNPVPLSESLTSQIRQLGEVAHIIAPAKFHSDHVMDARKAFPGAKAWGVPGHRGYARVAHIAFDGYLDDEAPLFPGEIDQVTLRGNDVGDVWLLDRASKTLLTTDGLYFHRQPSASAGINFIAWAWGLWSRNGVRSDLPTSWRDLPSFQASLQRALTLDFDHVASCHGSWRAIPDHGNAGLRDALGWILELRRWDAARLVIDVVRRHPGIVFQRLLGAHANVDLARSATP